MRKTHLMNLPLPETLPVSRARSALATALAPDGARQSAAPARIQAAGSDAYELLIYDVIDPWFGVSSRQVAEELVGKKGSLTVRINSPGGDVFEGRAIANTLARWDGPVKAVVDGLAASAATTIAMAADTIDMADGSFLMVHNSWAFTVGDKRALVDLADLLGKIDDAIAQDYQQRTGADAETVRGWMDAETWFTADEAVDAKLADKALPAVKASHRPFNLSVYANVPKAVLDAAAADAAAKAELNATQVWTQNAMRLKLYG